MKSRPIGVFDSGVGGLSILRELKKLMPKESFVFLADQAYLPYGEKSKKEIVSRATKIADFLIREHNIKILVIACNTATCYSIKELRKRFHLPIVGTEPAVKPAGMNSNTGSIAVISTPATAKSKTLKRLIKEFAKGKKVTNVPCKGLESVVENNQINTAGTRALLNKYLAGIKDSRADQLVLGCTHYPFLRGPISSILGKKIKLVDSGGAIARQTKHLLKQRQNLSNKRRGDVYFTTGNSAKFARVASGLLGKVIKARKVSL